jgi:hypothetical protein
MCHEKPRTGDACEVNGMVRRLKDKEELMYRNRFTAVISFIFVVILALSTSRSMQGQNNKDPYPTSMAPVDQYLMDRNAEIAMARSAAPPSIAKDATVLVFGKDGYENAVEGTNGYVCNVDRSWMDQFENSPEFWNPKRRGPVCYNPEAAKTLIPILLIRTKLALAGKSKAEIKEGLKAAVEAGELPALEPSAMAYMYSKQGFLNSKCGNCSPHLMFYVPVKDAKTWGAGAPESQIYLAPHFNGNPEPVTEFIVLVSEWSDGTPASDETPSSTDHHH